MGDKVEKSMPRGEYMDHLENLRRAVENKEREAMLHEIRDLGHRMEECHRAFK